MTFYIDYVNVDKKEHMLFNTNEIDFFYDVTENPITQMLSPGTTETIILHYTKPVKEIILVFTDVAEINDKYKFEAVENIEVRLNNIKLETTNNETYFRLLQPYYRNRKTTPNTNIYMYSFAIDPDNSQPTGVYNFGNIKTKELKIKGLQNEMEVHVYANTNNVMKVKDGYASIQFI
jgi:hypothetical protein